MFEIPELYIYLGNLLCVLFIIWVLLIEKKTTPQTENDNTIVKENTRIYEYTRKYILYIKSDNFCAFLSDVITEKGQIVWFGVYRLRIILYLLRILLMLSTNGQKLQYHSWLLLLHSLFYHRPFFPS